jgi:hypothetical protein
VKIAGTAVLHAPTDRVWAALNDPAVLARTIPGCSALEPDGPDRYRMTVTAGVASIKGVYSGEVALHDQQPPGSFRLRASGAGAPGTVRADVLVRLEDAADGTTALTYDADAVVGGMVGGVGQRMLTGVAKRTAGEFFKAVDGVLTGAAAASAGPVTAGASAAPVPAAQGQLLTVPGAVPETAGAVGGRELLVGAVVGAAAALLGVVVGARVARQR